MMSERGIVERGRLWIREGRIEGLYETETALREGGAAGVDRLRTRAWVFPGFIHLHTHLPFNNRPL